MTDRAFRPLRLSVSVSVLSDSRSSPHETLRRTLCLGLSGATRSLSSHVSHMFCWCVSRIAIPVCAEAERARGAARTDEATDVPERLHACTLPLRAAGGCSC